MFNSLTTVFDARVAAGVAFLSEKDPQWFRGIDLGTLEVHHGCRCVLAQLADNSWTLGIKKYRLTDASYLLSLGFYESPDIPDSRERYAQLTDAWKRAIGALQS